MHAAWRKQEPHGCILVHVCGRPQCSSCSTSRPQLRSSAAAARAHEQAQLQMWSDQRHTLIWQALCQRLPAGGSAPSRGGRAHSPGRAESCATLAGTLAPSTMRYMPGTLPLRYAATAASRRRAGLPLPLPRPADKGCTNARPCLLGVRGDAAAPGMAAAAAATAGAALVEGLSLMMTQPVA